MAHRRPSVPARPAALPSAIPAWRLTGVAILDGFLNVSFAFLVILFVTGGYVPGAEYGERTRAVEMWRMGPWVLTFLSLVLLRRLVDRHGTFGDIAFVRLVRGAATLLAARPRAVYLFTGVWIVVLFAVAVRQPWAFGYSPDLEVFDQALWNTAHGRLYRSSLVGDVNLLSEHFDPLNLLLAGFYLVYPSPLILLATQAIMLGLGAIPLYWLARDRFPGSVLAPLFPILYLLYLPIREATASATIRERWCPRCFSSRCTSWRSRAGARCCASSRWPGSSRRTCPSPAR